MRRLGFIPISQLDIIVKQLQASTEATQKFLNQLAANAKAKEVQHGTHVFYEDPRIKLVGCMHCNKHFLQCHAKEYFNQEIVSRIAEIIGVEFCQMNGKYTLDILKGYHFEWDDVLKRLIPALKYHLNYPKEEITTR